MNFNHISTLACSSPTLPDVTIAVCGAPTLVGVTDRACEFSLISDDSTPGLRAESDALLLSESGQVLLPG